jgi:hypothetical protein
MKPPRSPKRAAPPEFDVMEFLRPSDTDIKSALHTLIGPAPDLTPPVELTPAVELGPPPKSDPPLKSEPLPSLDPGINLIVSTSVPVEAAVKLRPPVNSEPALKKEPVVKMIPGLKLTSPVELSPGLESRPKKRNFAIREALTAADGHSRAEHDVYESLWREATPQFDGTRLITIGMLALARLSGLSESNARINLRSLQRKLAVEEHSTFVCENSLGRTWRVFPPEQILVRRRAAGLIWYMKRTLAVVFVDPNTGSQLNRGS